MTIVLTNDDGIDAPGIQSLLKAVHQFGDDAVIVAPTDHLSGCSHQVTTSAPIHVHKRSAVEYAIAGTPADCVRIALSHLYPDTRLVLSGINAGGNLGTDIHSSGTVAAVREAAMHGIAGIAISQYRQRKQEIDWDLAARLTAIVLDRLLHRPATANAFWNVNLPHLEPGDSDPEIVFCASCTQPLPIQYRIEGDRWFYAGEYAKRQRDANGDVEVCFSGQIAVTQVCL